MSVEKYGWAIQKKLIFIDQSGFFFLTLARNISIYKYILQNILAFLSINHMKAEPRI